MPSPTVNRLLQSRWSPNSVGPSLKLWLDAADLGTIIPGTGAGISQWNDKSGGASNVTQSTAGNQPTVGDRVVAFAGNSTQYFNVPDGLWSRCSTAPGATLLFVAKVTTDPPADFKRANAPFDNGSTLGGESTHYPYTTGTVYDSFFATQRKTVGDPSTPLTTLHIGGRRSGASDWRLMINGSEFYTTGTNTVDFVTTGVAMGRSLYDTTNCCFDGELRELILINSFMTTSDYQRVEGYLAWKWDRILGGCVLTTALPASHPYKFGPP